MKKVIVSTALLSIVLLACNAPKSDDAKKETTTSTEKSSEKPANDFFVKALVDGKQVDYPQNELEGVNTSNTYFTGPKETWAQGFINQKEPREAYFNIRLHKVDLEKVTYPYQIKKDEGSVEWFDNTIDTFAKSKKECQGVDAGCGFFLDPEKGKIVITSFKNDILEGTFEGKMILHGTGMARFSDEKATHTVTNGTFKIKLRRDNVKY